MSSGKHLNVLVILTIAFTCFICSFSAYETVKEKDPLPMHEGAIKTIYAGNREIIDCVPIPKEIDIEIPQFIKNLATTSTNSFNVSMLQTWRQYGDCPQGTAAKLRQPVTDQDYFRKKKGGPAFGRNATLNNYDDDDRAEHEYAMVKTPYGKYYGGAGKISVWKPYVERRDEFSLAQMWVLSGIGDTTETLEVGWHVYPDLYNDAQKNDPRLFIFWTADSYKTTGCYNLNCDAFRHTSPNIIPGATILEPSRMNEKPHTLDMQVAKDPKTGNWWLRINDQVVGYWPGHLFRKLADSATEVHWGGEIINYRGEVSTHTATEMGSGLFPRDGVGKSAFAHTLEVLNDPYGVYVDPPFLNIYRTNTQCYDLTRNKYGFPYVRVNIFFGGKGRSAPGCT